jgi:hypothetical protein
LFASFVQGSAGLAPQRIEAVVALALGPTLDPDAPLVDVLGARLDRVDARKAIESVLRTTLAYDVDWVDGATAERVAESFVACFEPEAAFWTNGHLWRRNGDSRAWTPIASATLDTGVVGVDGALAGVLWFIDED